MPGWLPCAPGKLPSLPRVSCPETLPSRLRQKARRRQATRAFCLKPGQNGPKTPTHRAWLEDGKARQGKLPSEKRSLVERLLSLPSGPSVLPQHNKSKRDRNLLRRSSEASGHLGFDLVEAATCNSSPRRAGWPGRGRPDTRNGPERRPPSAGSSA